jgi:hypothetical protein
MVTFPEQPDRIYDGSSSPCCLRPAAYGGTAIILAAAIERSNTIEPRSMRPLGSTMASGPLIGATASSR